MLLQTSPESANIFVLLQRIFRKQTPAQLEQVATAAGLTSEEYQVTPPVKHIFFSLTPTPFIFVYICVCVRCSGVPGVCSRSVCQHGKLQVIWRHQVYPKSAKGKKIHVYI